MVREANSWGSEMSEQVLVSLKANRIAQVQTDIDAAGNELDEAKKTLAAAAATLDAATGAADKEAAELAKQAAATAVDAAETKLKYQQDELEHLLGSGKWYTAVSWTSGIPFLFFGVLGGVVLYTILTGLQDPKLLGLLQYIPTSRGLITFLVTLVTVTIALILALSTIVSNSPDRSERFKDGKDLLFALIGVLGTIIGFYFGLEPNEAQLKLAPVVLTNEAPSVGDKLNLISFATGGEAPFKFEIAFEPKVLAPVTVESPNGLLDLEIDTATFDRESFSEESEQKIGITINVTDGRGATVSSDTKTLTLKLTPVTQSQ